ncbi:MAG: DUF4091 domain-containing protein [Fimbriimonadaceae bacterium]|nr:DUF4091 domain-containing protein [Fimbriimonadaceae bacterium]
MGLALLLLAAIPVLAQAPGVVTNGDFAQQLAGWTVLRPAGFAAGEVTAEAAEPGHGLAARIVNPAGEKVLTGLIQSGFTALPAESRTFRLRWRQRTVRQPQILEIRVAACDAAGKLLAPHNEHGWRFIRPEVVPAGDGWRELTAGFAARPNWGGMQLTLWVNGPGAEVWFDDLQVEVSDPRSLAPASLGRRFGASGAAVWTEGPLRKVYPDEAPATTPGEAIELAACRGECDVQQVAIRPVAAVAGASWEVGPFNGPGPLAAGTVRGNWVGWVAVSLACSDASILGDTPDPLLAAPTRDLPADRSSALWLTATVPPGTAAGTYTSTLVLRGPGLSASLPLRLRVYGVDLPRTGRLRGISRIWQSHDGALELFRANIAAHRGGGTSYVGGLTAQRVGDRVLVDSSGLAAAAAESVERHGFTAFNVPHVYLGDWSGPYAKDGQWFGFELWSPEWERAFGDYCRQVGDALRAAKLLPRALWQIWDEPHDEWLPRCVSLAKLVKQAVPDAQIYLTAAIDETLLPYVDIWNLPWPDTFDPTKVAAARARGASIWAYQNSLYSLDCADSSLLMATYPWRLRRYDVVGVEWWAVSAWPSDPWTKPNQYEPQNGGGFLLYPTPDRRGAPLDSLRWELFREGVEDYELLTLLAEREGPAAAQAVVEQIALSPGTVSRDPALLARLQRTLRERLETPR